MLQPPGQVQRRGRIDRLLRRQVTARQAEDAEPAIGVAHRHGVRFENRRWRRFGVQPLSLQEGADILQLLPALHLVAVIGPFARLAAADDKPPARSLQQEGAILER